MDEGQNKFVKSYEAKTLKFQRFSRLVKIKLVCQIKNIKKMFYIYFIKCYNKYEGNSIIFNTHFILKKH